MSDTIEIIGSAMRAEAQTLRIISQNIANAETIAYRRQIPVSRTQFDALLVQSGALNPSRNESAIQTGDAAVAAAIDQAANGILGTRLDAAIDMKPGTLKSTGDALHVALDGPGFFLLQSAHGLLLTRRGDLHLAPDGTLVTAAGQPVLGEKGPMQIVGGTPTIAADGSLSVAGNQIDRIRVVDILDESRLESLGDGTFRIDAPYMEENDSRSAVRQGFLEASNVVPVNEMLQLMETVRRFETEQKFARAYDGMLDKAISELGKI